MNNFKWLILENIVIVICMCFMIYHTDNYWWILMALMMNTWSNYDEHLGDKNGN